MGDLISRGRLLDSMHREDTRLIGGNHYVRLSAVQEKIKIAPTVDAVEVVHAMWIKELRGIVRCSYCGRGYRITNGGANVLKFFNCPNCGAKMDGGSYDAQDNR